MKVSSDIKPISYLKSHAADILKQINETHRPIVITQNGEPRAVVQDPDSYDNMRNAICREIIVAPWRIIYRPTDKEVHVLLLTHDKTLKTFYLTV